MKIILKRLEEFGLDGEFDLDTHPTAHELNRFRKEAGYSPSELSDALNSGLDVVRLYAYVALQRAAQPTLASKVFDLPLDVLKGIEVEGVDDDAEEGEQELPPTSGSGSSESELSEDEPSGPNSPESSALPD
jgi:hypothetical protein